MQPPLYDEVVEYLGGSTAYPLSDAYDKAALMMLLRFVTTDGSDVFEPSVVSNHHQRGIVAQAANYLWNHAALTLAQRQRLGSLLLGLDL